MSLRPYQVDGMNQIKDEFKKGKKKVLLFLSTGGGKTVIFCEIVKATIARGKKAIIVVRGRKLVDQASQRLFREGVHHGVLMNSHWNRRSNAPVQVCSIDTLIARNMRPEADLIIIDEAHMACSKGYMQFLSQYNTHIVAVTATPWVDEPLTHIAESVVHPVTMDELIALGFLKPFRYFAPSTPDLKGVHVSSSTHDYVNKELYSAMVKGTLTGNIIKHWIKIAPERPTLLFAVNIKHSKYLAERFLEQGIAAEHCDADTSDNERAQIIKRLESGETKVVCNVGILCTGVDIPKVSAIIMARPTMSRNLFIQQCGRGTRPAEGKSDCLILDHAGNIRKHGYPTDEPEVNLHGKPIKDSYQKLSKFCKECFAVYRGKRCPECGVEAPVETVILDETDEELLELKTIDPILKTIQSLMKDAKKSGKKIGWVYYKAIDKFGLEACRHYLPDWFVERYERQMSELFKGSPFKGVVP